MGGANNLSEVKIFLLNMFNDKNIITVKSNILRRFISFMIATLRYKNSQKNYQKIGGKSPIVDNTKNLVDKLQSKKSDYLITFAMRYTPPFIDSTLDKIVKEGIKDIYLLPMYPQFSTTTTKSSLEDAKEYFSRIDDAFNIKTLKRFYQNEHLCSMIVDEVKSSLGDKKAEHYNLIFSAHSLPQKIVENGDSYQDECEDNVEILTNMLYKDGLQFKSINLAYQSKLGPVKWLEPMLADKLKEFDNQNVIIYPLSFTIDNLETDFELSIEYKEMFSDVINDYIVCKCPNDKDKFVDVLSELIDDM
jgi:ferrochelatase